MKTSKTKKTALAAPARKPAAKPIVKKAAAKPVAAKAVAAKATVTPKSPVVKPSAPRREITTEAIASLAHSLWEQQGRPHGRDLEFWLKAESQLKA